MRMLAEGNFFKIVTIDLNYKICVCVCNWNSNMLINNEIIKKVKNKQGNK